jgi:hypothetical protein
VKQIERKRANERKEQMNEELKIRKKGMEK